MGRFAQARRRGSAPNAVSFAMEPPTLEQFDLFDVTGGQWRLVMGDVTAPAVQFRYRVFYDGVFNQTGTLAPFDLTEDNAGIGVTVSAQVQFVDGSGNNLSDWSEPHSVTLA